LPGGFVLDFPEHVLREVQALFAFIRRGHGSGSSPGE
jgi:hypothetical protein